MYCIDVIFAIIMSRIFPLPVDYPQRQRLKCPELKFCLLFCMGLKLVLLQYQKSMGCVFKNTKMRRLH